MKIAQIRFGDADRKDEFCPDDRFVLESQINGILDTYKTARVFKVVEMDIRRSEFVSDAREWKPVHPFEHKATIVAGKPSDEPWGYPETTTTVLVNNEPRNVHWKITWALAQ